MKSYIGNYVGIVLQNDDPEHRGRVKVFVPHISVTIYDNWNKEGKDRDFTFPDKDTNPDLDKIMEPLKEVLPWAECASPLFGGNASGRYNCATKTGTTSDSNYWENDEFKDGNRPLQNFVGDNVYKDAFSKTDENDNKFVNQYAYQYTPSNYSNLARGLFTIPNVGSHVWVFFAEGNPNFPVYFASSYGKEDWERIYSLDQKNEDTFTSVDYPGTYENRTEKETISDADKKTFRAKTVFNSNKHSIELVDTDNREILKMTHFSGSFKEFCNYSNIELAANNDQKMVVGDQFYTVQKNQSIYVGNSQDVIVAGDRYKTIGPKQYETAEKILVTLKQVHEIKRLFDGQRTGPMFEGDEIDPPGEISEYQYRVPNIVPAEDGSPPGFALCPVCGGIPYTPAPTWQIQQNSWEDPVPTREELNLGNFALLIGQVGYHLGSPCAVCNPKGTGTVGLGTLPTDRGYSPSSQDGNWMPEPAKLPGGALDTAMTLASPILMELQKELGGGDEITTIAKNKVETIGLVMNDLKSFRVDPIGKLRIDGVNVALEGTYETFKTSPHVEYVDVDDVPGGDYNLTCNNKYKLLVGAKGINIKTFGPMDMYGTIVNMIGEQVNISSQNEVLIDGGERFSIRARKISLIPVEHQPVVVDGQMHVTRNAIIKGGLFVEGEVGVMHMTAPYEFKTTETISELENEDETGGPINGVGGPGHIHMVLPHTHKYKHIATTFLPAKEAVRDAMRTQGTEDVEDE